MRLIVIEVSVIERVYLFEVNELEPMRVADVEPKKRLRVKRNRAFLKILFEIFICPKQLENQQLKKKKRI